MKKWWIRYVTATGILLVLSLCCALPFLFPSNASNSTPPFDTDAPKESLLLEFTSNGDGTCYISGMGACTDANVVVPSLSPQGDRVTEIGKRAFYACETLESVFLPTSVAAVTASAFYGCENLESVTFSAGLQSIGAQAFFGCSAIKRITIPTTVTHIGRAAFAGCTDLGSIIVEQGNSIYHSKHHCIIETASKTLVVGCENSTIPDDGSVTTIGASAFAYTLLLQEIEIPEGVTQIGLGAFMGCRALKSVTLPESLTVIDRYAFAGCTSLQRMAFPEALERINPSAFESCTSLRSVFFAIPGGWRADTHRFSEANLNSPQAAANYLTGQFLFNNWVRDQ